VNVFGNVLSVVALGANAIGYGGAVAAAVTVGTIGYNVYSYFSQRSKPPVSNTLTNDDDLDVSEPNTMQITKTQPHADYHEQDLYPYTDEELRQYPLSARSILIVERAGKIREIESQKQLIKGLIKLQNEAKTDELTVQKDIMQHDQVSRKLASISEGEKVEKVPVKEIPLISQAPKEIKHDNNNDIELEKVKLKVERTRKNPTENSQLVKSSSAPKSLGGKRRASESETPLTVKNIDLSNAPNDFEPPLKKAKSNSEKAIITSTSGQKLKGMQICTGCNSTEKRLFAQRYPEDGKPYCYRCHIFKNKCCSYKPSTGGRICYRSIKDKTYQLCEKHPYTTLTSEIIYDDMDES